MSERRGYHWLTYRGVLLGLLILVGPWTAAPYFRGDEVAGRDFALGPNFFINRWTYEPGLDTRLQLAQATNYFHGAGGSLSSRDLYLVHLLDVQHELTDHYRVQVHYLRDRDFDGSYQRFTTGLGRRWGNAGWIEILGEPVPNKALADIGAAIEQAGARWTGRLQLMWPNWLYDTKNMDAGRMHTVPNIQVSVAWQPRPSWRWTLHADLDPPRRWLNPSESFDFHFEKYQGDVELYWFPDAQAAWHLRWLGEWSDHQRDGLAQRDPAAFTLQRTHWIASLEYTSQREEWLGWRAGALHVRFDEDWVFAHDSKATLWTDRYDRILFAGHAWPLQGPWYLNTMAIVSLLSDHRETGEERLSDRSEQLQARTAGSMVFAGDTFRLEGGAAVNWHRARFGGGFVKVWVDF